MLCRRALNSHNAPIFRIDPDLTLNQIFFSSSGSNRKPITLPVITELLTDVAEPVIRLYNFDLLLGQLGMSLILRFEDFVEHSLSYELGAFGSQHLRLRLVSGRRNVVLTSSVASSSNFRFAAWKFRCARYSIRYRSCHSSWTFKRSKIWSTLGAFSS